GTAFVIKFFYFIGDGIELFFLGAIDNVGIFQPAHGLVGRNHNHFQLVDFVELGGFGFGGTGHSRKLLIHAEVVLEGDGGQSLVFALDLNFFFGFDGLVQSVGPAAAGHHASGEIVNDDDLAILHYVLHIAAI